MRNTRTAKRDGFILVGRDIGSMSDSLIVKGAGCCGCNGTTSILITSSKNPIGADPLLSNTGTAISDQGILVGSDVGTVLHHKLVEVTGISFCNLTIASCVETTEEAIITGSQLSEAAKTVGDTAGGIGRDR